MRVGTASQPASIASETKAQHGEMEYLINENKRLQKEARKKEKNMEELALYAFNRFNMLAAETKEFARLYDAARSNCKDGVVLPELAQRQADEPLGGKVFEKMYADSKILMIEDSSGDGDGDQESQDLSNCSETSTTRSYKSNKSVDL